MNILDAVNDLLHGEGVAMLGRDMPDSEAIKYVRSLSLRKQFCLVRKWIWIDLEMPDAVRDKIISDRLQPVMIYAHNVIFDSASRFNPGDWVRSTLLAHFSDGHLFETQNTVYVLIGPGVRKSAQLSTVIHVF
jgi:hypothetical protein